MLIYSTLMASAKNVFLVASSMLQGTMKSSEIGKDKIGLKQYMVALSTILTLWGGIEVWSPQIWDYPGLGSMLQAALISENRKKMKQPKKKEGKLRTSTKSLTSLGFLPLWILRFYLMVSVRFGLGLSSTIPHIWTREILIVVNSPELLFCNPALSIVRCWAQWEVKDSALLWRVRIWWNVWEASPTVSWIGTNWWWYLGSLWNL